MYTHKVAIIEHANIACERDQSPPRDIFILPKIPASLSPIAAPVGRIKNGATMLIPKLRTEEYSKASEPARVASSGSVGSSSGRPFAMAAALYISPTQVEE